MSRKIVVTGGAGFIGSALARALVARGDDVSVLDNFSTGKRENLQDLAGQLAVVEGDILDAALLDRVFAGADVVFHEAAIPSVPRSLAAPLPSHNANATGTLNVLEAARRCQVRRVVYAGSSSAYGEPPSLPVVETMAPAPLSPYAVSKLAGEHYLRVYARVFGVQTVTLRYFNVFGPRQDPNSQYAAVIPRFITAALENRSPTVYGDGERSAPGSQLAVRGGDPAVHHGRAGWPLAHRVRRWRTIARFLFHRQRGRGESAGRRCRWGFGQGLQHRLRNRHQPESSLGFAGRGPAPTDRGPL